MGRPGGACRCGGARGYDPDPPKLPNILNQLVATLHDTGLEGNPQCQFRHRPDARYPGRRILTELKIMILIKKKKMMHPESKYPPPIFKGLPGE